MPVNGIELKKGQIWSTPKGNGTLEENRGAVTYIWKVIYGDGGWDAVDEDGLYFVDDTQRHLIRLIHNPEDAPKYTVEEVVDAVTKHIPSFRSVIGPRLQNIKDYLQVKQDPEYQKYLELKEKYESN